MKKILLIAFPLGVLLACSPTQDKTSEQTEESVVNVYTHRHYDVDQQLFDQFEKETGIKVNVVNANADELIQKMEAEGEESPADVHTVPVTGNTTLEYILYTNIPKF